MRFHTLFFLAVIVFLVSSSIASTARAQVRTIIFPVSGEYSFRNDFAEPRAGGAREHLGIDIIADKMTPVVAVADGTITYIAIPQASWGYSITIRDSEGYSYRYLHLNNDTPGTDDGQGGESNAYASGLARRTAVTKGQIIGWVGDSGNAEATVSHLHFEIRAPDRTTLNPYETLLSASGGQSRGQSSVNVMHSNEGGLEAEEQVVAPKILQEGMIDQEVKILQGELESLGYYAGEITDTYDSVTREAVRRFQNAKGLAPSGIADVLTRKALTASAKFLPLPVKGNSSSLSFGSTGEAVKILQQQLKDLGYFSAEVTGYFGPLTEKSLIAFQNAKGIDPIGVVGPKTRAALDASSNPIAGQSFVFTMNLQQGSRGEDVRKLQLLLQSTGYFTVEPTGYFGAITRVSVIAFQNAKGIEPLGSVGPKTRAVLNTLE
ncbi:MAG: hypothetical protein A2664_03930 [Candidatus Taylorbacteria bacterium RIFCSPHIGHO2_01_FULL_46_22b]|uniref:Peptidase M23 domain-containing protein n=1 Tax=Candidatus Taylorbacteria bacterium RIFCSPHIGHO2_01_FULL_46_22b TaxID=1802301 RepID=A0A1G2M1P1_9BACT|nr:MAG: hypothetical protein A2664_03930 [Candidatus Taylorbacteria bacterium RIFCSPHIGHO2_01_FULL_46_22b]